MVKVSETDSKYISLPEQMKSLHRNVQGIRMCHSPSNFRQTDQTSYFNSVLYLFHAPSLGVLRLDFKQPGLVQEDWPR